MEKNNIAFTENGAISYASAGKELIDQFAHVGTAMGRPIETVFTEQEALWNENPEMALRFPFYLRLITRKVKVSEQTKTETVQKGAGLRDESLKRLLWIAEYYPEEFENNIWLLPVVGSWKDVWTLMVMAEEYQININNVLLYSIMAAALDDSTQCDLIRKYMPAIRSNSKCKTAKAKALNRLAKEFAYHLGLTAQQYRKMKASGTAHDFQKLICSRAYADIDWNTIPGKALTNLISGKFLDNHCLLDNYIQWVKSQPTVKFTGYVYELGRKADNVLGHRGQVSAKDAATVYTLNKQFDGLIELAKKDAGGLKGNVLCALDTSGSMTAPINGGPNGLTSYDVCVSLGIYFAELNEGFYHNKVAMFDNTSSIYQLSGDFTDKWSAIKCARTAWGGTNFQSLIDLLVDERRKHPEIPESEFPQTLLVVSDMQFNPSNSYWVRPTSRDFHALEMTNLEAAKAKLRTVFSDEFVDNFKFIWWNCSSRDGSAHDVPATMDHGGNYLFSGFDGSIITLLLSGDEQNAPEAKALTMEEMVNKALSQEVFSFIH